MDLIKSNFSFEACFRDFLMQLEVKEETKKAYQKAIRNFMAWVVATSRDINSIQRLDILAYKDALKDKSSYTINLRLSVLRSYYKYLEGQRIYPNIANIKGAKRPKGHRKDILTPEQIRECLSRIDKTSLEGKRNFAVFNLMIRTGLRVCEIAGADIKNLKQQGEEATLHIKGKGRDDADDFVLLTADTLKPIREYLTARGDVKIEEPLFVSLSDRNRGQRLTSASISRIMKRIYRETDLDDPRITAHSLRHSAISLSVKGGASLEQASAMARHSDLNTTAIYFHNYNRIENGAERCINF